MYKLMTRTAAIMAIGAGVTLATAPASIAQTASPDHAATTQGAVTLDRARGGGGGVRIGGGHRGGGGGVRFHGGGHRHGGGRHYRGGRYIVPGIIIGSGIAAGSYYYGQRSYSCGELEYRCDRGEGWACRRLDDDPRC